MNDATPVAKPIEDYGVVGDMGTVALIGVDGALDFMCFPRFDSPTIFAALLDPARGGTFQIAPAGPVVRRRQMYLPDTNLLVTRFLSHEGVAELTDFMPVDERRPSPALVRRIKCVRGRFRLRMLCAPRFDYARAEHTVEAGYHQAIFRSKGADATALRLRGSGPLEIRGGDAHADFELGTGESAWFVLEEALPGDDSPAAAEDYVSESFKRTVNFWRAWLAQSTYRGRWREMVDRSALVLKLLTSQKHGSIVAAPTFGLPESIGGVRNWDYRYVWIRDASFTLYALSRLGFQEEAGAFTGWLDRSVEAATTAGDLQIMYGIDGRKQLDEQVLGHLGGYRGSRPVRVGNDAYHQLQLDIYGELLDSVYLADKFGEPLHHDLWRRIARTVDWLSANWQQPDEGLWEVRSGRADFLYSRVMCWVAFDRALRLAQRRSLPCDEARWRGARDKIHEEVFRDFWDEKRGTFVQSKGSKTLDAATLIMPLVRMISPTDPRWLSTLAAIEGELVEDSLVYRYRAPDGLDGGEGTFSMCSFWFVECLSRSGDLPKARLIFERMLGHANHLGLYSEQLGPCGEHLGNYPQAFTHLALISAAFDLDRRLTRSRHDD